MEMATYRQKLVASKLLENNGSVSAAMRQAEYSPTTAKNPQQLTNSKAWPLLMEKYWSDQRLARIGSQGLRAKKHWRDKEEADHYIRHMFFDTVLKLRNKYPKEQTGYQDIPITIQLYGNNTRRTARVDQLHAPDHGAPQEIPGTELAPQGQEDNVSCPPDGRVVPRNK